MLDPKIKKELLEKYPTEQVFVVPFHKMSDVPDMFSISRISNETLLHWQAAGRFIFRHDAEYNLSFCQLIPYIIVMNRKGNMVYAAKRIAGDSRLVQRYSLGFGGHINPCDSNGNVIINAANRELDEETVLTGKSNLTPLGLIRDVGSETSEHIGIVFVVTCDTAEINERESLSGVWMSMGELMHHYGSYERWSQFIINHMYANTVRGKKMIALERGMKNAD